MSSTAFQISATTRNGSATNGTVTVARTGKAYSFDFLPDVLDIDHAPRVALYQTGPRPRLVPLSQLRDVRHAIREHFARQDKPAAAPEAPDARPTGRFTRLSLDELRRDLECHERSVGYRRGEVWASQRANDLRAEIAGRMVPQPSQPQQAKPLTLYRFEAIGEARECGPAPRGFQAAEGITPRTVRAETIHIRSRADWKAFSRAARSAANDMVGAGAGECRFWFNHSGRVYRANVERIRSPRIVIAGRGTIAWHGKPLEFGPAMITAVPRRALIARELEWVARYRANAMRDRLNASRRAYSIKAARKTLDEARALYSAHDKLP